MKPVEEVAALYEREACARTFREDVEAHLLNGCVFSTAEIFVLARPVWSGGAVEEIRDPWWVFERERCDAWLVYAFAGDINQGLQMFPYHLGYVGWERGGRNGLRFLRTERVIKTWGRYSGYLRRSFLGLNQCADQWRQNSHHNRFESPPPLLNGKERSATVAG